MTHSYLDDVIYQPFKMKLAFDQFLKFTRNYVRMESTIISVEFLKSHKRFHLRWLKYQFIEIEMNYEIPIAIDFYSTS